MGKAFFAVGNKRQLASNREFPAADVERGTSRRVDQVVAADHLNLYTFALPQRVAAPEPQLVSAGGRWIRTCMGLFLSSSHFWFVGGSLFGAGKPFFVPSPAIRFAERAEGVKGPKR